MYNLYIYTVCTGHTTQIHNDLRQTKAEQHESEGFVWLTRTKPGPVQFVIVGGGQTLGVQVTVLVVSSQIQFWHLYSNLSLN